MRIWFSRSLGRLEVILAAVLFIVAVRFSHVIAAWSLEQGAHELGTVVRGHPHVYHVDNWSVRLGGGPGSRVEGCETMLADLQRSVAWQPYNSMAYYLLAKAQYQCQDLKGAVESALNWLWLQTEADPLYDPDSRILVESYLASNERDDLKTLLQGSQHITAVLLNQGDRYLVSGNVPAARELFELGSQISHNPSSFYLRLGEVYQMERNFDQSLKMYEMAFELDTFHSPKDESRTYVKHGEILFWTGRNLAQSIEDFDAAITIQPDSYSAHLLKGIALYRYKRDSEVAFEEIQTAIAINPSGKEAFMALGNLYRDLGQKEAAKQAYLQVVKRDPGDREAFQALISLR